MEYVEPDPKVTYLPEEGYLYIETDRPFGVGETIAKDVVVFRDREDPDMVVGLCIGRGADVILQPFVDAILAQHDRASREAAA